METSLCYKSTDGQSELFLSAHASQPSSDGQSELFLSAPATKPPQVGQSKLFLSEYAASNAKPYQVGQSPLLLSAYTTKLSHRWSKPTVIQCVHHNKTPQVGQNELLLSAYAAKNPIPVSRSKHLCLCPLILSCHRPTTPRDPDTQARLLWTDHPRRQQEYRVN